MRKKRSGRVVKPSTWTRGLKGSTAPMTAHVGGVTSIGRLGRLRVNGTRRVRMTNTTRVWVARDSMNQPVRNSLCPAWRTWSMTKKVMKSKMELIGPKTVMNRRTKEMSHAAA